MNPAVSVVMAAKNYGRFLAESVDSVRAQTVTDWELLIVDDGSTDDTPQVAARYRDDQRIRYVKSDRLGQTRAKNLGIDLSRGEIIAFLDADDVWLPTKLEKQLARFQDSSPGGTGFQPVQPHLATIAAAQDSAPSGTVGVVFSRRTLINESGEQIAITQSIDFPRGRVLSQLFSQNFVCFSSAIVRREVFSLVGRFDPQWELAIDYDLWLRVAKHYAFDFVDEALVKYRTGHGNLSKKLADRVGGVVAIMHRNEANVSADVTAEGFASTYRTLGYVMRKSEPVTSLKWYWKALMRPHQRLLTVKGMLGSLLALLRGRRDPGAAENASVNR